MSAFTPAENQALDAWAAAENERNRKGFWLAHSVASWAASHPGVLPDYLADEVAEFSRLCEAYDAAAQVMRDAVAAADAARSASDEVAS